MKTLFTSAGASISLGRELGKGGEGSVFDIPGNASQIAKAYHKPLEPMKQAKLRYMASIAKQQPLDYVAWPQDTLHASRNGPVVGFLMPRVSGKAPIHMVYSPAHRRQDYPNVGWDFLLWVARNVAACFEAVHSHGHIIGDVNQNSFMVGRDSKVVLIDSDSFQVNANRTVHHCEVGVSHFTPPELQALSLFAGFSRTQNHDNFGLALLIFHVLFGGRHPYSGVPLRSDVGETLEKDIKNYRYAYARDNNARGLKPPPRSIPVSMLPDAVEAMFHAAFTEAGSTGGRPSARQWVSALDILRQRLKTCGASKLHIYPSHLGACPWCALDQAGVLYFIDLGETLVAAANGISAVRTWALIQAVPVPSAVLVPTPSTAGLKPAPRPKGVPSNGFVVFLRLVVVCIGGALLTGFPEAWFLWVILALIGWTGAAGAGSEARRTERQARQKALEQAKSEYEQLVARVQKEAGPEGFLERKTHLSRLKDELGRLPQLEQSELNHLHATAQERQKVKFLERFFIDQANIPGVGPTRKAALRSFGIETAADVSSHAIRQVRGFGDGLTRAVLDWKNSCARQFHFNPATAVTQADRNTVRTKFISRKNSIESTLSAAPRELHEFRTRAASRAATLMPAVAIAAQKYAQAQVDRAAI